MSSKSIDRPGSVWYNVPQMGANWPQRRNMEHVNIRMPREMIEQVKQVANEMALLLDTSNMSFSDALRHLVKRGLQDYHSNGHDGDPQNGNSPSVLHR